MNFRLVANITSYVLWVEAGFLLLPLAVSVFSGEAWLPFFITAVLCILIGGALHLVPVKNRKMHGRDGFMAVALGWIALSLTGALPYVLTGALVVSWDNYGFQESFAASLTCISNVGPGLGILGPMENFSILSPLSKLVLSLEMLTGRLELMPMLALMTRGAWSDR